MAKKSSQDLVKKVKQIGTKKQIRYQIRKKDEGSRLNVHKIINNERSKVSKKIRYLLESKKEGNRMAYFLF